MTPRERLCRAMRNEDVDFLPCSIYFNPNLKVGRFDCARPADKIDLALELGLDPFVPTGMQVWSDSMVRISTWETTDGVETQKILWQAWDTPAGRLTQAVKKQGACAEWSHINWGDESAGAVFKPLIETAQDAERFAFVFRPATETDAAAWVAGRKQLITMARSHDLPVVATYGQGLANLLFTMGAENAVMLAIDKPAVFETLAETIHIAELRNIELAAMAGVDILKRFGGYEMCNFYNPDIFDRICVPRLRREVQRAHELGLIIFYRVVTGMEPLLDRIASIGFDCIEGGEPRLSQCSLEKWHTAFDGKAASWTGISTPVRLGGNNPAEVREEVRRCIDIFGKKGFILGVTNSIRAHFPWENTLAMIDEWKKFLK